MSKIEIFCVTNIPQKKLEALNVTLVGRQKYLFKKYITCLKGKKFNIKKKLLRTYFSLLVLEK